MATHAKPEAPTMEPDEDDGSDHREAPAGGIDPAALVNGAVETIAAEARAHPYRTVGIAFAVGYVLGGGVPRFAVRMATTAALRALGRAVLTSDAVADLARGALGGTRKRRGAPVKNGARKRTAGRFTA
jgi:hypothetical protein